MCILRIRDKPIIRNFLKRLNKFFAGIKPYDEEYFFTSCVGFEIDSPYDDYDDDDDEW